MNKKKIHDRISKIVEAARAGNGDIAIILENTLREEFIKYLSESYVEPRIKEMARQLLTTNLIDFDRRL